jgi:hypothetical protein
MLRKQPLEAGLMGETKRSHLTFGADGGLTLHVQTDSPGQDKARNRLPAPKDVGFKLALTALCPQRAPSTPAGCRRPSNV